MLSHAILKLGIPEIQLGISILKASDGLTLEYTALCIAAASFCSVPWSIINITTIFLLFFFFSVLLFSSFLSYCHSFYSFISSCYWSASHSRYKTLILQVACGWHPHSIQHQCTHGQDPRRTSACTGQSLQGSSLGCLTDSETGAKIPSTYHCPHGNCEISGWIIAAFYPAIFKASVPIWLQLDLAPVLLRIGHHA